LLSTLVLGGAVGAVAQEQVYEATMTARRGLSQIEAQLTISVQQFSTEEDANRLVGILQDQGSEAFIAALRELDRGVVRVVGGPTARICHVRVLPGENGSRVVILTDGPVYFPQDERRRIPKDVIGVIQLVLSSQGQGRGSVAEATKVRVTEAGTFEVEASQVAPIDISNVRQVQ
jgi:hypothetical protein